MSSAEILKQKQQIVEEISGKMKDAESFVLVDYQGLTVEHATALRAKAREMGADYKVYKNTFMNFAAKNAGYEELSPFFNGVTAIVFSNEDAVAPAKLVFDYVNDNKLNTLTFKGGVIDKKITSAAEISEIAKLPAKEVLLGQILGSLNAPISNLVYALNAIKEKMEATA